MNDQTIGTKRRKNVVSEEELSEVMEATSSLTDEAFEDWLHERFHRPALLVLAGMAAGGDIKALDAYLKRADAWRQERAALKPELPAGAVSFLPARTISPDDASKAG